ncbi:MAG: MarR family winged helix-turn-helix transcriptional regulator [Micrococcaceae bacterium]
MDLSRAVGHLLRRAQQRHAELWAELVDPELTSSQFAVLETIVDWDESWGIRDQGSVAGRAGLDVSTGAEMMRRLEAQGWLQRVPHPLDSRRRVIKAGPPAAVVVRVVQDSVQRVQERLCSPLTGDELRWALPRWFALGDAQEGDAAPDRPGQVLRLAQQRHSRLWAQRVSGETTSVQFAVLNSLDAIEPLMQSDLAERAGVDRSTGSSVIQRLARRNLVERRAGQDKRQRLIELSESGRALLAELSPAVESLQRELLAPVDTQDHDRVIALLNRLVEDHSV